MSGLQFESGNFLLLLLLTIGGALAVFFLFRQFARHLLSFPVFFLNICHSSLAACRPGASSCCHC